MKRLLFILYKVSLLVFFMASMHSWFTWGVKTHYIGLGVFFVSVLFVVTNKVKLHKWGRFIIISLLLIVSGMFGLDPGNKVGLLAPFFLVLPCSVLFLIRDRAILHGVFEFIANFFAKLLPISLVVFYLSLAIDLPRVGTLEPYLYKYGTFANYVVCVTSDSGSIRFSSIFLEPGHLGTILAFLLFVLKFKLKDWRVVVFSVSILCSLSLAGVVLSIFGVFLYAYSQGQLRLRKFFVPALVVFILFTGSLMLNDGNNYLKEKIFDRLKYDSEKGFVGNNRVYGEAISYFEDLVRSDEIWFGMGLEEFRYRLETSNFGGAGWKVYLMQRGLLSLLCVGLGYVFLAKASSSNFRYSVAFFVLYALAFWQRAYPLWASWLILFYLGNRLSDYGLSAPRVGGSLMYARSAFRNKGV